MKRIKAEYPFNKYWLYVVWHRKENRNQANLVLIENTKERTTMSYARYLMSVKLGRFLTTNEQVDHIDNDKTNDTIENLQILTPLENKKKQEDFKETINPRKVTLECSFCGKHFQCLSKNYRFKLKQGRTKFFCSKACGYNS